MGACLNPLILRIIYLSKIVLNLIRFLVPLLLIVKVSLDVYKKILDPKESDDLIKIRNRIVAGVIVFFVPTLVGLVINFINNITETKYSGLSQCLEFASPEYIKELETKREEEERLLYLTEQQKTLSAYEKMVAETRAIIASQKQSTSVGTPASKGNTIKCGSGSSYNTALFNTVRSAGYKSREGVTAAAIYLASHIDVHIPYFWSGGHFHSYNGYSDTGENLIGVADKWGCDVKMAFGGTDKQKNGVAYPFGMDCSGFLAWAIFNGGYYTGDSGQSIRISTDSTPPSSIGEISVSSVKTSNAKGKIKPGDIAHKSGHVGMVIAVSDSGFTIAEEMNYANGLVVTEHKYSSSRFTSIILMDNFYANYQKGKTLWSKFK